MAGFTLPVVIPTQSLGEKTCFKSDMVRSSGQRVNCDGSFFLQLNTTQESSEKDLAEEFLRKISCNHAYKRLAWLVSDGGDHCEKDYP